MRSGSGDAEDRLEQVLGEVADDGNDHAVAGQAQGVALACGCA